MRRLAAALVLALVAGCAGSAPSPYAGTTWTLERVVGADGQVTRGSGDERLTFGADGQLSLASCNQCGGRYTLRGDVLTVPETMACTRRGCPDGQIELERIVRGPLTLRREGAYLVVESRDATGATTQALFVPETAVAPPPAVD